MLCYIVISFWSTFLAHSVYSILLYGISLILTVTNEMQFWCLAAEVCAVRIWWITLWWLIQDKLVSFGCLRHSDQFCTDKSGNTLLMVAAHAGSAQSMKFLLSQLHCPINAQNQKVNCHYCRLLTCISMRLRLSVIMRFLMINLRI